MVAVSVLVAGVVLGAAFDADAQRRRRRRRRIPPDTPGTLVIESTIENAEVLVDEETVGFTPLAEPIEVTPGSHTVRVRRPGYTEFTDVIEVEPGQELRLPVDMMALAMVLTVRSTPDMARVFVDGTFRGNTPIELELIEGEHSIRVTAPRYHEQIRTVQATAGTVDALDVELEALPEEMLEPPAPEWYEEPITWVVVGAAAAAVAVAVVVTAVLLQPSDALNDYCGEDRSMCYHVMPMDWQF
jgi:hypothetical protein